MSPGEIADALDKADRLGQLEDSPEGTRYIQLSDTLARKLSGFLREAQQEIETLRKGYTVLK